MLKLRFGNEVVAERPTSALRVEETKDAVTLDNCVLKIEIQRRGFVCWIESGSTGTATGAMRTKSESPLLTELGLKSLLPTVTFLELTPRRVQVRIEQR